MISEQKSGLVKSLIFLLVVAVGIAVYLLLKKPAEKGTVESAKEVGETVPEITTNPGAEVPEVNPLDRVNPFKYQNPLR